MKAQVEPPPAEPIWHTLAGLLDLQTRFMLRAWSDPHAERRVNAHKTLLRINARLQDVTAPQRARHEAETRKRTRFVMKDGSVRRYARTGALRTVIHKPAPKTPRLDAMPVTLRNERRPREHRSGQTRTTRAGPDEPSPHEPPRPRAAEAGRAEDSGTRFQRALVAALDLDRDELGVLADHVRIRLIWLDRWIGEAA